MLGGLLIFCEGIWGQLVVPNRDNLLNSSRLRPMKPLFNMGVAFIVMSTTAYRNVWSKWVADEELGALFGPCSVFTGVFSTTKIRRKDNAASQCPFSISLIGQLHQLDVVILVLCVAFAS